MKIIATAIAAGVIGGVAVLSSGITAAHADDTIPNANCTPNTDCYHSYLYGRDWSLAKYMYLVGRGTHPSDLLGYVANPEPAVAFCRGVEADASSTGYPPGDVHHFRGGCMDTVLTQMAAYDPNMDMTRAFLSMMGQGMPNAAHSDHYPAAPNWRAYYG
ncbi:hypothetical protein AU198_25520 [Mycobacterium sp. GA-1199]|uniref:hypothetical protein n=1 Tax=Mycobacterium sp. GA-1199 TaxID=1772287 RepID=UPI00074782EE|nr:hypothetical protein [Mycobacterium sp. GA-1199]KUI43885.1 hypothetical protein AU198_25520 [Mycobacterium sp. GA-1199]